MKKILVYFWACFIFFHFGTMQSYAQENPVIRADSIDLANREEQMICIEIDQNTGLMGFKLHFEYSENDVEILDVQKGSVTRTGNFTDNIGCYKNTFDLLWNDTENVTENGSIAFLRLKVLTDVPFQIEITYCAPDTFNEDWEDVALSCHPIYAGNEDADTIYSSESSMAERMMITNAQTEWIITNVLEQMSVDTLTDLEPDTKETIVHEVNAEIQKTFRIEENYYSDYAQLEDDYKQCLIAQLKEEADQLDTEISAGAMIDSYLAEQNEKAVTAENVMHLNDIFVSEGLNSLYGKYLTEEELLAAYTAMAYGNEDDMSYGEDKPVILSSHAVFVYEIIGGVVLCGGIIFYIYRRMKKSEEKK